MQLLSNPLSRPRTAGIWRKHTFSSPWAGQRSPEVHLSNSITIPCIINKTVTNRPQLTLAFRRNIATSSAARLAVVVADRTGMVNLVRRMRLSHSCPTALRHCQSQTQHCQLQACCGWCVICSLLHWAPALPGFRSFRTPRWRDRCAFHDFRFLPAFTSYVDSTPAWVSVLHLFAY